MKKSHAKQNNAKNVILAISIALVSVFFVAYAIQAVYPAPKYSDFCDDGKSNSIFINNSEDCETNGGMWKDYSDMNVDGKKDGYCNRDYYCSEEYNEVRDVYERNVFIINLVLGIVIIVASLLLTVESVSTGFMAGGAILLVYGTIRYWSDLSNVLKTLVLGIVLGILIWLGYKKLK